MGVAYFIVLDKKKPGFDTSVNGKAVAGEVEAISKITKKLKLPDINELASFADLAAEFGADPESEGAEEKWFDAEEGLAVGSRCPRVHRHASAKRRRPCPSLGRPRGVRVGPHESCEDQGE